MIDQFQHCAPLCMDHDIIFDEQCCMGQCGNRSCATQAPKTELLANRHDGVLRFRDDGENREEVYLEQQMDCNGSVDWCVCAGSLCTSATW